MKMISGTELTKNSDCVETLTLKMFKVSLDMLTEETPKNTQIQFFISDKIKVKSGINNRKGILNNIKSSFELQYEFHSQSC